MNTHKLGLDFGNTIVGVINGSDSPKHLQKSEIPDSIRIINRLVREVFGTDSVYVISKVSGEGDKKVLQWMHENNFFARTGIYERNIIFCTERHEKGPLAEKLGITHFVDDRPEVIAHMPYLEQAFLFRARENEFEQYKQGLWNFIRVTEWIEIEKYFFEEK